MEKKFLLISIDDEKTRNLADILGNRTCKKIIDFLSETKEASEKDIADSINLPINTTEYNLNKLIKAELVEKTKNFFWSQKGKKIPTYKLSNKSIVISPKSSKVSSKIKSILPAAVISGIGAVLIRQFFIVKELTLNAGRQINYATAEKAVSASAIIPSASFFSQFPAWAWFLTGTLFAIIVFSILNWKKI